MRLVRAFALAAVAGLAAPAARADVKPHPLFTDNMVLQRDAKVPVWGTAEPGEKVTVTLARRDNTKVGPATATADDKGRWRADLPPTPAGVGFVLGVHGNNDVTFTNVAVGDVWIGSGQSNMEWAVNISGDPEKVKAASKNPNVRLFTVGRRTATEPVDDQADMKHLGKWVTAGPDTVGQFSAVLLHFGQHLQKELDVPVGLIHTSWGGTPAQAWTSAEALAAVPELKHYADAAKAAGPALAKAKTEYDPAKAKAAYQEALKKWEAVAAKAKEGKKSFPPKPQPPAAPTAVNPHTPASLYNGMIHPLLPFAIKGAVWYQGESNAGNAEEYRVLYPTMIQDWRKRWGTDFPFYGVMLAPFNAGNPTGTNWPELREAQYLATKKLKNVGIAVITDAGDPTDIHPKDKQTVGKRLALSALAQTYGKDVEYRGPEFKAVKFDGDKAVVTFDHIGGGLVAKGDELTEFTIAGEDKEFHPAKAEVQGDTVVVSSDKVSKPVAVRFAWRNYHTPNLFNKAGLPAVPFRTDDFPLTSRGGKK